MDYRGQQFSEYMYYFLTIFFGAIAWLVGYFRNDFHIVVNGWATGLGLALVLCIPDWPMFSKHPVEWGKKKYRSISDGGKMEGDKHNLKDKGKRERKDRKDKNRKNI